MDVTVEMTVVRVFSGGNASAGNYFYSFSPSVAMATQSGKLIYKLSKECSRGLKIHSVVTSASVGQLEPAVISKNGKVASLHNHMVRCELINVAVVVADELANGELVKCDPQVLNEPD